MFAKIVGVQDVDWVNPDTQQHIVGKNLYCMFTNSFVDGYKTNKYFVSNKVESFNDLVPDINITIDFNERGKIDKITVED